jgi:ribosome-binding protein aMBF1 (putative translation factor)
MDRRESARKWNAAHWNEHKTASLARRQVPLADVCELCGSKAHERHHEDYSRPLLVMHVCRNCHVKIHKERRNGNGYNSIHRIHVSDDDRGNVMDRTSSGKKKVKNMKEPKVHLNIRLPESTVAYIRRRVRQRRTDFTAELTILLTAGIAAEERDD